MNEKKYYRIAPEKIAEMATGDLLLLREMQGAGSAINAVPTDGVFMDEVTFYAVRDELRRRADTVLDAVGERVKGE